MAQGGWEMMGGGWCGSVRLLVRLDDGRSFGRAICYFISYVIGGADVP